MNWLSSYIFQSQLLARDISDISSFNIITVSRCIFTQITTQLSAGLTVSSQFLWVCCVVLSHQKQSSVNDGPQKIHSVSCCVSVTVCVLFLCSVLCQWQFAPCCYVLLCVSDSLRPVVMSCFVLLTVCSLLLCPVVCQWQYATCCYVLFCVSDSLQLVVLSCCVSVTVCVCCYVLFCVSDSL
jgi:hypothetical protein